MEEEITYTDGERQKDIKEILWQNRVQTIFLALAFFLGISSIFDIYNKIKK